MGDNSKIEWTEATWNPIAGCSKVSAGCQNCYAMRHAHRIAGSGNPAYEGTTRAVKGKGPQWTGQVNLLPERLDQPLRWKRPRLIFVNSMSDLFHPDVPFDYIDHVFAVMALADRHTFQVLTKRPDRMAEYFEYCSGSRLIDRTRERIAAFAGAIAESRGEDTSDPWWDVWLEEWPLRNVWLGTSVENQDAADVRIPHLLRTPAAVRFLSCEPLLGPVRLDGLWYRGGRDPAKTGLHWVIAGGESGPGARPMHPDWARSLRDQCQDAGVAYHFKQWGAWVPTDTPRFIPNGARRSTVEQDGRRLNVYRVGKKTAGRKLDGRTWDEMPGASP